VNFGLRFLKTDIHETRVSEQSDSVAAIGIVLKKRSHRRCGFVKATFFHQELRTSDRDNGGFGVLFGEPVQDCQGLLGLFRFVQACDFVHIGQDGLAAELDLLAAAAWAKRVNIHFRRH
jgi:hypothetical protein